jgi:hypothetical protein
VDSITKKPVKLNVWITTSFITPWAGNILDSLYFAIVYTVLWVVIMGIYNDKKSHIRL